MRNGKVREAGSVAQIFGAPADVYTRALIHCRPDAKFPAARLLTIDDWSSTQAAANQAAAERCGLEGPPGQQQVGPSLEHRLPSPTPTPPPPPPPTSTPTPIQSSPQPVLNAPILEVRHLRKVFIRRAGLFGRDDLVAVHDLSFSLARGKTIGIVGESGSGKTTAGLCIVRLHPATAGEVVFDGKNLLALSGQQLFAIRRRLQIVFQNPYASLNPRFTIAEILAEPMRLHHLASGAAECNSRVRTLLDRVGLPASSLNRYPHEFSGGQRQRIAIARCLALEPEVIVCDEAVSALDVSVQAQVLNLLKDLQRDLGLSYVFISHDLAVVRHMADELLVMLAGKVVEQGDAERIYLTPAHAYTRALLDAIPRGYDPQRSDSAPGGTEAAGAYGQASGWARAANVYAGREPHA
jgi:peptide/nickel transport system ATP-binding protein